ncbi:hypothetical protein [Microbacterium sp. 4-7]|uniref:hypothetical protein n=1 Tax=Microbacterium sp. 4-7 TaxID=1885327 RepID=UPI00164F91A8|nr:hypothetical protein [Microbacterium sp. 4-7]MBC6496092.1 hypothetical protein [Microbacterium sp. 4-7]
MTDTIEIPRPHVPYGPAGVPERLADADYLDSAARNLAGGYAIGGYNVTSTVIRLLHDAATVLRTTEVTEPSDDTYELTVDMLEGLLVAAGVAPGEHGTEIRKTAGALVYKIRARQSAESQGEAPDAQLLARGFRDGVDYIDDQPGPWGAAVVAGRAEAARRVAAARSAR